MFVMGELDRELPFFYWLGGLARVVGFAEGEASIFSRRDAHVAHGADGRAGPDHRLPREELLPVTTDTSIVFGKIGSIWKISLRGPGSGNFMTGIAGEALVFFG